MGRFVDLTGQRFGKLIALEVDEERKGKNRLYYWKCTCDCGNKVSIEGGSLRKGKSTSCGQCSKNKFYILDNHVIGETTNQEKFYFDLEDFEKVSKHTWFNMNGYITARINKKQIKLHRFVLAPPIDMIVDHINHKTNDCCKANLRICTHAENMRNRDKKNKTKSIYKGVSWHNQRNKWQSTIQFNLKHISLGLYDCEEEAALAYNKKAIELFGEFANLNKI